MAALTRSGATKASEKRHVDLPHAAVLTFGDAFGIRSGVGNEFVSGSTLESRSPASGVWERLHLGLLIGRASNCGAPSLSFLVDPQFLPIFDAAQ